MRRITTCLMLVMLTFLAACEKETIFTIDQTTLSFTDNGGTQSIFLTANKPWTASSNQAWCKVSPSGGEESASNRITITCDANTIYDARNCAVTFTCAEMTKTVSISQATNNGLLVSQTSYELTKAAQQLNIQVQANVKFSVEVDNGCKDWISYNTTKSLATSTVVLDIAENKKYDSREGKVTIKENGGSLSSTVTIKQSQLDGLFITTPEYNLSNEQHTLTVEVTTNVEFDVKPEADWVKYVQTKGLNTKQIILEVAENDTYDQRETKVSVKQKLGDLCGVIRIKQNANGIVEFEDDYFKAYCVESFDTNKDGEISYTEALRITSVSVCTDSIISITGIEHFSNLSHLSCICTTVWDVDLQQSIGLGKLTTLDVSKNTALEELFCYNNQLTNLELSNNLSLKKLFCAGNRLTNLDVTNNTELIILDCSENQLTSLDVIKNTELMEIECSYNRLTNLDVSNCTLLTGLSIDRNQVTSLDISKNTALKALYCSKNRLTNLDVSNNTNLTHLYCSNNQLTSLNVNNNINLQYLDCSGNGMISGIAYLNVSECPSLISLDCGTNRLTSLDVSHNPILNSLRCEANQLTSLDVSNNTALVELDCRGNKAGISIILRNGQVFGSFLHDDTAIILEQGAPIPDGIVSFNDSNFKAYCVENYDMNEDGEISFAEALIISQIVCDHKGFHSLSGIEHFTNMTSLFCRYNHLTNLDVSHNTALSELWCDGNQLTKLDVTNNTALTILNCEYNQLTSLDVSNNLALTTLLCTNNPSLTEIWLHENQTITNFEFDSFIAIIKYK